MVAVALRLFLVSALCSGALLASRSLSAPGARAQTVEVNRYGTWTLDRLGYSSTTIRPPSAPNTRRGSAVARADFAYSLPEGAAQGPEDWYRVRLHAFATIDRSSGSGFGYLTAYANGSAVVQVELETSRHGGRVVTHWTTVGLVEGPRSITTKGPRIEVDYTNYIPYAGVDGGVNQLSVIVEQARSTRIRSVTVASGTAVIFTPLSPANAVVDLRARSDRVRAGEPFDVAFRIQNTGESPLRFATVGLDPLPQGVVALDGRTRWLGTIPGRAGVSGSFRLRAESEGLLQLGVSAVTSANLGGDGLVVSVEGRARHGPWLAVALIAGGFAILLALAVLLGARRRRQIRPGQSP